MAEHHSAAEPRAKPLTAIDRNRVPTGVIKALPVRVNHVAHILADRLADTGAAVDVESVEHFDAPGTIGPYRRFLRQHIAAVAVRGQPSPLKVHREVLSAFEELNATLMSAAQLSANVDAMRYSICHSSRQLCCLLKSVHTSAHAPADPATGPKSTSPTTSCSTAAYDLLHDLV
jgi:hypothetical protein